MTRTGLGQDGFLRVEKETNYGDPDTTSMTLLPIKSGSLLKGYPEMIENDNVIASRLKQDPDLGRIVCPNKSLTMNMHPDILGLILNIFLGTSSDVDNADGSYTHTWLTPIAGDRISKSMTVQQAIGQDLMDQFAGCMITAITLRGDTTGNSEIIFDVLPQSYTEDVARITTFTYPTTIPLKWCHWSATLTPSGQSAVTAYANNFELRIDLGYDLERYKFGSCEINQPVFNTIPAVTLNLNVDADRDFLKYARAHQEWAIELALTSTELAGSSEYYKFEAELPVCRLASDTEISNDNDALSMDLSFDCGYGGITTGSGTTKVHAELRLVDTIAAYA